MAHQSIFAADAPRPAGPYSPAITWENLVFISGQGPTDPQTGQPVAGGATEQTRQVLRNVERLLEAAGSSKHHVLKVNVYLANIEDFADMNSVYAEFFEGGPFPARTTIQAGALPGKIGVEIDAIAYRAG